MSAKPEKLTRMLLQYKIMPNTDVDVDVAKLMAFVKKVTDKYDSTVKDVVIEQAPIGFGLMGVRVEFKVNEKCGSENYENQLKENSMVGEVVMEKMDRM